MEKDKLQTILETLAEEFHATIALTADSAPRDYVFPEAKNAIKVAVGMRRSGKTYFLFQTIRNLIKNGLHKERLLYINFEDDRILPIDYKLMGEMVDAWYTLHPENHNEICHLFFDEVQNIEGWPLVLRRILDTKKVQLYITGSSAKLLSKEIATSLRGRSLPIEIFPFSFKEFLTAHNKPFPSKPLGQKTLDVQRQNLLQYFVMGGFPGIQFLNQKEQLETLQQYVETVIFRDVIERHQIENVALLRYLIQFLLKSVSSPFSINKFYNDVKSQGYKVGKDTLYTYISYLEDAFFVFTVPIFSESLRKGQTLPKKVYAVDNGLIGANTFNLSPNFGKMLENQVYLDLRRQGKEIFYYQTVDGFEIDFVTKDIYGKHEMVQVVWDTSDLETIKREERALQQAEKELGFSGKLIDWKSYLKEFASVYS